MYYVDSELMPIMVQEVSAELDNSGAELTLTSSECAAACTACYVFFVLKENYLRAMDKKPAKMDEVIVASS